MSTEAPVRIFIMHPARPGAPWHVSVEGECPLALDSEAAAVDAALAKVRACETMGLATLVRKERPDGGWEAL
ncbi:hypothetical protein L2Y96_12730 [Luteibacter aegosomaticola]|uniref:hypothetical protein n=1 Tax=Luteibacter aegosomaticola TaxID=2911538 RepID=UPI001FF82565|nr:hypothetical protein [Luteibacter aegosomaticola]UPG88285.1 hypothetical protein L2Y96_12730 [Luteibacter aegosomaticola]